MSAVLAGYRFGAIKLSSSEKCFIYFVRVRRTPECVYHGLGFEKLRKWPERYGSGEMWIEDYDILPGFFFPLGLRWQVADLSHFRVTGSIYLHRQSRSFLQQTSKTTIQSKNPACFKTLHISDSTGSSYIPLLTSLSFASLRCLKASLANLSPKRYRNI